MYVWGAAAVLAFFVGVTPHTHVTYAPLNKGVVQVAKATCMLFNLECAPLKAESVHAGVHSTALRLEIDDSAWCSGTAVAPHIFLSAAHCFVGDKHKLLINYTVAAITDIVRDDADHVLVTTDATFKKWAAFGPTAEQGDVIFTYGNPTGIPDMLRFGHIAGFYQGMWMYDINDWHGDSGAAVFDTKGRIVGVISTGIGASGAEGAFTLAGGYPLRFTVAQLLKSLRS